jgi:membrane-associated phospholipid phosphatase
MIISPAVQSFLRQATAFGDAEYLLPLVVGLAVALWASRQRDNARALALALGLVLALTVGAKIALMIFWRGGPLRSPSGHAALAAFVYGSIALLLWSRVGNFFARILALGCGALAIVVAISRFVVGGHSRTETLVGLVFGALGALWLSRRVKPLRIKSAPDAAKGAVAGSIAAAIVYFVITEGEIDEERIRSVADWLRARIARF